MNLAARTLYIGQGTTVQLLHVVLRKGYVREG